jgi:hypothetical protein
LSRSTKRLSNCFMLASLFVSTAIIEKILCQRESNGLCSSSKKNSCFKMLECSLLRAEGFSCSLEA